jgi:hypothetical protein
MTEFISQGCFLVHNEKEEFMQTVRLDLIFFPPVARFLMLWRGREAGSRAKRNGNAGLVWRHSFLDHREVTIVLREF